MNKSLAEKKTTKVHVLVYGMVFLMLGMLIGSIMLYFIITPSSIASRSEEPLTELEKQSEVQDYYANKSEKRSLSQLSLYENSSKQTEDIEENTIESPMLQAENNKEEKSTKTLTVSKSVDQNDICPSANKEDKEEMQTMITSKTCNIRTGPGTDYAPIKVVDEKRTAEVIDCVVKDNGYSWYQVSLEDGTKGYISGSCLKSSDSEKTSTATLTVNLCPSASTSQVSSNPDVASQDSVFDQTVNTTTGNNQPIVIEVPNEKYDYRPGDYHGEVSQFLGRPISEVLSAFPSFTLNSYDGSNGNIYDNFWTTVEFRYVNGFVSQIVLSQCDPSYSLLGVSVGMDSETARNILSSEGYPFTFQGNLGYWMHSEDDHYEVEVDLYEGKVLTIMYWDLTTVDPWWKNNGVIY